MLLLSCCFAFPFGFPPRGKALLLLPSPPRLLWLEFAWCWKGRSQGSTGTPSTPHPAQAVPAPCPAPAGTAGRSSRQERGSIPDPSCQLVPQIPQYFMPTEDFFPISYRFMPFLSFQCEGRERNPPKCMHYKYICPIHSSTITTVAN